MVQRPSLNKEISTQDFRDFLADNPTTIRDFGLELCKINKSLRGDNIYHEDDLKPIEELHS